jgi:hypothetical protein
MALHVGRRYQSRRDRAEPGDYRHRRAPPSRGTKRRSASRGSSAAAPGRYRFPYGLQYGLQRGFQQAFGSAGMRRRGARKRRTRMLECADPAADTTP